MTVGELIEALKRFPEDHIASITFETYGYADIDSVRPMDAPDRRDGIIICPPEDAK